MIDEDVVEVVEVVVVVVVVVAKDGRCVGIGFF